VGGTESAVQQMSARAWKDFKVNNAALLCVMERQMVRGHVLAMGSAQRSINAHALRDGEVKSVPHLTVTGSA